MGIAAIQCKTFEDKQNAVRRCKDKKPSVEGRSVYVNYMQSELQNMLDKPIRAIQKTLREQWIGDGGWKDVTADWKQRTASICHQVVCKQEEDLTIRWYKRRSDLINLATVASAPTVNVTE